MTINQRYYHVFVGTYGGEGEDAIQLLLFDSKNGSLKKVTSTSGIASPSFLAVNHGQNRLYAVSEVDNGEVVCYDVDIKEATLTEINRQSTDGSSPCFVSLDKGEQWLFTANYGGGSVVAHALSEDGVLFPIADRKSYNAENEKEKLSHPHSIAPIPNTNKFLVTDLGFDGLYLYQFNRDTSTLELVVEVAAVTGSGPRHFAIHPELQNIYVVNEFNSSISVYSYDDAIETLELVQQIETIPDDFKEDNYGADIHLSPTGSYLYASNRGHHSIATYKILGDGRLSSLQQTPTMGEWPRNFAIVPNAEYLLVANEHSDSIVVMKIDEEGIPRATEQVYSVHRPVCLKVMPVKGR
ncbi:lactonase family protein [Radiobacillus kanasensis]|uniref:lactonase family protein n=1 Tax=Radiobacillus kanasensis TaxID=2844358 RepID=UPI001E2DEB84|nr:lactonase family protein [Radiobacillus kanasensis]UFT98677.1 lactonase family protein [Radiobacillus kanasensis]